MTESIEYGELKLPELKKLLRNRGARTTGRKRELVERLEQYDRNAGFGYDVPFDDEQYITLLKPPDSSFKDINRDSPMPPLQKAHITEYLKSFSKEMFRAQELYENGYLTLLRYSQEGGSYFLRGSVKAEMTKQLKYYACVQLSLDGDIEGAECECAAGNFIEAHCKHVIVVLLGLEQMVREGMVTLEKTCTEKLQTFHMPKKTFTGSPVKADQIRRRLTEPRSRRCVPENDPMEADNGMDNITYQVYFRNLCISYAFGSRMPIMHLIRPANTYAVAWDHDYCFLTPVQHLLKSMRLWDLDEDDIAEIEKSTRGQRENERWMQERKIRITASNFFKCCNVSNDNQSTKIVESIMDPSPISSKAITHGIIYEKVAIKEFESRCNVQVQECGLFVILSHPYLAASPDALLAALSIVEVKCTYSIRDQMITPKTLPYLYVDANSNLALKKSHPYYYQVQGQLKATGRLFCDFIIFTFKDFKRISIERDDAFIDEMLKKLDSFYHKYFEPRLLEVYLFKNYGKYDFQTIQD